MDYQIEAIEVRLKTQPVMYGADCLPIDKSVWQDFDNAHKDREAFDIWEMSLPAAEGWLGVVDAQGDQLIKGVFKTYTHLGAHQNLMEVCHKIAREHPRMTEFYCVYLNSPAEVAEQDLKTKIIFRESDNDLGKDS